MLPQIQSFHYRLPQGKYVSLSIPYISSYETHLQKQMLQPKYSMHGFNWFDTRGIEGTGPLRAIRTLLTNHLPTMLPDIRRMITERLKFEIAKGQVRDGKAIFLMEGYKILTF